MTEHGDQLREAFETHESQTPDPAVVYARVQELARSYQWRRRGAQVAGGAVLGAGLLAGPIFLPGLLPGNSSPNSGTAMMPAAAPAPSASPAPSVSPSMTPEELKLQKQWDAYFSAGYDYDDAVKLAKLWKSNDKIGMVKAEAGRRLLAGETLPIKPGPNDPDSDDPDSGTGEPQERARVEAFFAAGYDYDDAVKLAKLWKKADPYQAKVEAGLRLLAGDTLPLRP